jgi:hypothetical protein
MRQPLRDTNDVVRFDATGKQARFNNCGDTFQLKPRTKCVRRATLSEYTELLIVVA